MLRKEEEYRKIANWSLERSFKRTNTRDCRDENQMDQRRKANLWATCVKVYCGNFSSRWLKIFIVQSHCTVDQIDRGFICGFASEFPVFSKQFWQLKPLTWNFKIFNEIAVNYEGNTTKVVYLKVMKPFALSDCIFLKQRSQQIVREKLSVLFSSLFSGWWMFFQAFFCRRLVYGLFIRFGRNACVKRVSPLIHTYLE